MIEYTAVVVQTRKCEDGQTKPINEKCEKVKKHEEPVESYFGPLS